MDYFTSKNIINEKYPNVRVTDSHRQPNGIFMSSGFSDSDSGYIKGGSSIEDLKRKYIGNTDIKGGPAGVSQDGLNDEDEVDVRIVVEKNNTINVAKDSGLSQRTVIVTKDGVKGIQG